jgi:hypothetical protein
MSVIFTISTHRISRHPAGATNCCIMVHCCVQLHSRHRRRSRPVNNYMNTKSGPVLLRTLYTGDDLCCALDSFITWSCSCLATCLVLVTHPTP